MRQSHSSGWAGGLAVVKDAARPSDVSRQPSGSPSELVAECSKPTGPKPAANPSPLAQPVLKQPVAEQQQTQLIPSPISQPQTQRESAAATTSRKLIRAQVKAAVVAVRTWIASVVWLVAVVGAIILSLGALLIALKANTDNVLVDGVLDAARGIDGPFWKMFDFYQDTRSGRQGPPDEVKNHLVNWGLAAVGYLVAARILERVVRPS